MTREELLTLPVTVDVLTAGRAFGFGRNTTYELVNTGKFPVEVQEPLVGKRYVRSVDLQEALGFGGR
uniref:DNA-binding protein n=1 Tax=Streptomyces sp. NBC_00003 TaxID=2903608 RepID=A0AAU2V7S0_9ACTN